MNFDQGLGTCPAPKPTLTPSFYGSITPHPSEQPSPLTLAVNLTASVLKARWQTVPGKATKSHSWTVSDELVTALPYIGIAAVVFAVAYFTLAVTYFSPFQRLQRPPTKGFWSLLMGHLAEMQKYEPGHIQMEVSDPMSWVKLAGRPLTCLPPLLNDHSGPTNTGVPSSTVVCSEHLEYFSRTLWLSPTS
jgi:hypothetical protein